MPERARARSADCAPGPGVFVPRIVLASEGSVESEENTIATGRADLDVESRNAQFLAARGDILGRQHGCIRRGLVTIGLDFHAAGDAHDGFATAEIRHCLRISGLDINNGDRESAPCTKVSLKLANMRATPNTSSLRQLIVLLASESSLTLPELAVQAGHSRRRGARPSSWEACWRL
jgi:hypothetical protein